MTTRHWLMGRAQKSVIGAQTDQNGSPVDPTWEFWESSLESVTRGGCAANINNPIKMDHFRHNSHSSRTCAYRRTGTRPCEPRASPTRASRRKATCTCKYRQTAPVVWPQKHASPGCAVSPESVLSTGCVDKLPPFGPLSCFPRAGFLSRALGLGNSFGGDLFILFGLWASFP